MRCIFVLDILNGAVVHAVRGERSRYEPISSFSRIVTTSSPQEIMQTIHPREVYVADLNMLTGQGKDNLASISEISQSALTMADIGICRAADLEKLPPAVSPVLGTETASLPLIADAARAGLEAGRSRKIVVSIDMRKRKILSSDPNLANKAPLELLSELNRLDLEAVILLELDRVGTSSGLDAAFLKRASTASEHPLILGGGVKGKEDLQALEDMGFSGALVATAVHNGRIPVAAVQR
ncbi:MAG TPA: HisA/HisF-related TIM barrel protein [Methanothrix sp.]|nr:HisA/HisF-related TIM barrel protein [Methanothrix sp.]